jgi:hypothetical protein
MNEQKTFVKVKVKVKKENIIRKSSKPEQTKCSKEESGMLEKSNKSKKGVIPGPQRPGRDSDPDLGSDFCVCSGSGSGIECPLPDPGSPTHVLESLKTFYPSFVAYVGSGILDKVLQYF